ncbi:hypothetical protein F4805DRAFT_14295 [Annulohypoxylon moriforme]|nr:hypothetical protein F4805DRAFT_14295 [Annulohypoxylon moriforme]
MSMAPGYHNYGFTLDQAIQAAGGAPHPSVYGYDQACLGEPAPDFFLTIIPATANAIFSTNNGERPFRTVENPVAFRDIDLWDASRIQAYADELRSKFYTRCMYIQPLPSYHELYIYFDAHDIYYLGAQNLWNVLHHMHYENQVLAHEQSDSTIPWIDTTIQQALFSEANQIKLREWKPESMVDILTVFSNHELGPVQDLPEHYHGAIRSLLMNHWMYLRRGGLVAPEYQINSKYLNFQSLLIHHIC